MTGFFYRLLGILDNLTAVRQSLGDREHVLVRPFNQAVLMWPTALLGLWSAVFVGLFHWDPAAVGRVYVWTLFVNYLVLFFDLRFMKTVLIVFALVIAGFLLDAAGRLGSVTGFFGRLDVEMNATFYVAVSCAWAVIFFFVWLDRRSYIIVVEPNHVVIHDKWIGEAQSYPTENVAFSKEIDDAVELLLGFGTLKLRNATNGQLIRAVPHVFRISHVLDEIKRVTAQFQVEEKQSEDGNGD